MSSILCIQTDFQDKFDNKQNSIKSNQQNLFCEFEKTMSISDFPKNLCKQEIYAYNLLETIQMMLDALQKFIIEEPNSKQWKILLKSLNLIKGKILKNNLDEEYDQPYFSRILKIISMIEENLDQRRMHCVLISYAIFMHAWIRIQINQRLVKIFFLPIGWYLKFQVSQAKPPVQTACDSQDLSMQQIKIHINHLNKLTNNHGFQELFQTWNQRKV